MIIVSELGDKTFFIAAIMAMRHSRVTIFLSAAAALFLMTVLSVLLGFALPKLLPRSYTQLASIGLFVVFGFKLLKEAYEMDPEEPNEELEEVETELDKKELEEAEVELESMETGAGGAVSEKASASHHVAFFSPIFVQCFMMTFLAEWGDRSQIATIALAASQEPFGVTVGGCLGHAICTAFAVVGGKLLAAKISERTVSFVGALLFLVFAVHGAMTFSAEEA
jgi:Ca2+/H+ antiporter, TMEM165/GDT1 family